MSISDFRMRSDGSNSANIERCDFHFVPASNRWLPGLGDECGILSLKTDAAACPLSAFEPSRGQQAGASRGIKKRTPHGKPGDEEGDVRWASLLSASVPRCAMFGAGALGLVRRLGRRSMPKRPSNGIASAN